MAAKSVFSGSSTVSRVYRRAPTSRIRTYNWPPWQLNVWIVVMLLATTSIVGVFSVFIQMQTQLELPIPWYFPYYVAVGCIAILYIGAIFWLIATRRLLPAIVMMGVFVLFVLWLVGLVVVSLQLWGPNGSVQSNCNMQVFSQNPTGKTITTLAWMQQRNIYQFWQLVFAVGLIGAIFLVWIMIMAYQVFVNS